MTDTITTTDLREIDEAEAQKSIPAECRECKNRKPENCSTCSELEKHGYSFETGV